MHRQAGFTLVELTITISVMVLLMVLAIVALNGTQAKARDEERKTDTAGIARFLEDAYQNGVEADATRGSYLPTSAVNSSTAINSYFSDFDKINLRAPNVAENSFSIVPAQNNTSTVGGVQPQPTISQYVYQPIALDGTLCATSSNCRSFGLFYRLESDNTVYKLTSRNQ